MLNLTWNMGGKPQTAYQNGDTILPDLERYDLVAICAQECPRKVKTARA